MRHAVDAAVLAGVTSNDSIRLDLIVGGKFGRMRIAQDQGLDEEAFVVDAFGAGRALRNQVALSSAAEARVDGIIGASTFTSVSTNVAAPLVFTMTHSDAGPGLDWDPREQTLRFGSAGLIVSFAF